MPLPPAERKRRIAQEPESAPPDETVYRKVDSGIYHDDESCTPLKRQATNITTMTREYAHSRTKLAPCKWCILGHEPDQNPRHSEYVWTGPTIADTD